MMNIKADRDYMTTVLDRIVNGKMLVPKFQRDFVWSSSQMLDLFDSILKGFPIGSLILWTPETEKFKTIDEIEGVKIDTIERKTTDDVCYILDGRQRITTLISVLFADGDFSKDFYVNLNEMRVLRQGRAIGRKERFENLLLSEGFDTYSLIGYLERLKSSSLPEPQKKMYAEKAKQVNRILQSYELGYINVRGGSIDDAVEIFSRLNSKATAISKDYMIQALAYSTDSDFLFGNSITRIRESLAIYNFKEISRDLILKCVFNHTEKLFFDGRIQDILSMKENLPQIMEAVEEEVNKSVQFLYTKCGVIDNKLLPYTYHLVLLADFFRVNPSPSETQIEELKKWFFYTTYSGYFTNSSLARIREDIKAFRGYAVGVNKTPIEYTPISLVPFPEKFSLRSVRVCSLVAMSVLYMHANENLNSVLECATLNIPSVEGKNCVNTIVCTSKTELSNILELFKKEQVWDEKFNKFCLDESMLQYYANRDFSAFMQERKKKLISVESDLLRMMGLDIEE